MPNFWGPKKDKKVINSSTKCLISVKIVILTPISYHRRWWMFGWYLICRNRVNWGKNAHGVITPSKLIFTASKKIHDELLNENYFLNCQSTKNFCTKWYISLTNFKVHSAFEGKMKNKVSKNYNSNFCTGVLKSFFSEIWFWLFWIFYW